MSCSSDTMVITYIDFINKIEKTGKASSFKNRLTRIHHTLLKEGVLPPSFK